MERLTLQVLWTPEVVGLGFDVFKAGHGGGFDLLDHVGLLLEDDAGRELREALLKENALVAHGAADVDKDGCLIVGAEADLRLKIEDIEELRHTVALGGHPVEEVAKVLRVGGEPVEGRLLGLVADVPGAEVWVGGVLVVCLAEVLRDAHEGGIDHLGAARGQYRCAFIGRASVLLVADAGAAADGGQSLGDITRGVGIIIDLGDHASGLVVAEQTLWRAGRLA